MFTRNVKNINEEVSVLKLNNDRLVKLSGNRLEIKGVPRPSQSSLAQREEREHSLDSQHKADDSDLKHNARVTQT